MNTLSTAAAWPSKLPIRELMDFGWWPHFLRDAQRPYLARVFDRYGISEQVLELLAKRDVLRAGSELRVLDLCSGQTAGIWPAVLDQAAKAYPDTRITVVSTDLFPAPDASDIVLPNGSRVVFDPEPCQPEEAVARHRADLVTCINGFHHIETARRSTLLAAVAQAGTDLLVVETLEPTFECAFSVKGAPVAAIVFAATNLRRLTPAQALFSLLIPVMPASIFIDTMISGYRTHRPEQMKLTLGGHLPAHAVETVSRRDQPIRFYATLARRSGPRDHRHSVKR